MTPDKSDKQTGSQAQLREEDQWECGSLERPWLKSAVQEPPWGFDYQQAGAGSSSAPE